MKLLLLFVVFVLTIPLNGSGQDEYEDHPCFHADPFFPDLSPGERKGIQGEIIFFEGSLTEFEDFLLSK